MEQQQYGDPLFYKITTEEVEMYSRKNKDYAGGAKGEVTDPNGNFKRCAQFFSMYPGISLSDPRVIALSHMLKQLDQVCWSLSRGYEGEVEGLDPRFMDIHIYAKIARVINQNMSQPPEPLNYDPNANGAGGTSVTVGVPTLEEWAGRAREDQEAHMNSVPNPCCMVGECTCGMPRGKF